MFKFFNMWKKNDRSIEQIIVDIANDHHKSDYQNLYRLLRNEEVFIPVLTSSISNDIKNSEKMIMVKSFLGPKNQPLMPAATKSSCAMLAGGYLSMNWVDFLKMVLIKDDVEGTFLEGESSWVKLDKQRITYILNFYGV